MRRYLDTSLIVASLVRESGTEAAKAYLSSADKDHLVASRWLATELSSALALKVRTGVMSTAEQTAALGMFHRFTTARLALLDVEARDFDLAAALCDETATPLRAGDALHLAVCKRVGARMATFDRGMAAAAQHHGLPCDLLFV
jgi:hypothetical protein